MLLSFKALQLKNRLDHNYCWWLRFSLFIHVTHYLQSLSFVSSVISSTSSISCVIFSYCLLKKPSYGKH